MPNIQKLLERLRASFICEDMRAEYPPTFDQELNYQCGRILFFASLITMVAWLPYIPLDRQLHPEEPLIPAIRAGLSAVSLIIFVLYISRRFPERNLLFLNILGAYLAISCGLITGLAKADPVYLGGNLFILTLLAVVPVKRRSVLIVLGAALSTFFIVGYIKGMSFQTLTARYSLQDLMSAVVVAVIFVYLMDKKRYESWLKSKKIEEQSAELKRDKEKIDKLLLNILPAAVARELKDEGRVKPVFFPSATIAFTDFVGFTEIAEKLTPDQLVWELHELFTGFDRIMDKYGLEKLKTIGDAYMYAGGVPSMNETHAMDAVLGALEIQSLVDKVNREKASSGRPVFEIRIGMNSGPLMAGVVGEKKFVYDIWGDSVNLANRMESSGCKGKINISESTHILIKDYFETEARGRIVAKNKGTVEMYFVNRIKPEFSSDEAGLAINERFRTIYGSLK